MPNFKQWFVGVQITKEVSAQAHHRAQSFSEQRLCYQLRKPTSLMFLTSDVKLFALIDVK
jgi:hypothetical protein